LKLVLIDPKNEDLRPYANLPHVLAFAGTLGDVADAVERVAAEVRARIDRPHFKPYRLLLVVDELAQLTQINGAIKTLGNIMSIGRSKLINCVVCTQQPTEEGGMGTMMKANVPLRLVGAVSAGQSYTATRRKNAGADMLPGNGAFLFLKGLDLFRFQSYYMDSLDERHAVAMINQRYCTVTPAAVLEPVLTPTALSPEVEPLEPVLEPLRTGSRTGLEPVRTGSVTHAEPLFPLREKRPLTRGEAVECRRLMADGASKSELCRMVYGSKNGQYLEWINQSLGGDGKIISLQRPQRTGTGGD
jgi:hypothetical protein